MQISNVAQMPMRIAEVSFHGQKIGDVFADSASAPQVFANTSDAMAAAHQLTSQPYSGPVVVSHATQDANQAVLTGVYLLRNGEAVMTDQWNLGGLDFTPVDNPCYPEAKLVQGDIVKLLDATPFPQKF